MAKPKQASRIPEEDREAFAELSSKPHDEQARWFMNAFWGAVFEKDPGQCEEVWKRTQKFVELDPKHEMGNELDEALSHKFLESLGETLTVLELREKLRTIDIDMNGHMSMSEYLLFRYEQNVSLLVRPQANPEEVQKAQAMVNDCLAKVEEMKVRLDEQETAFAEVKAAEEEAKRALDDLNKQQDEFDRKCRDLEAKSQDQSLSVVKRNKAAAELAQFKAEDPLPLRRAKITQEAAVRRLEKARKIAEEAKAAADKAHKEAEKSLEDAMAYLQDVKSRVGSTEGTFWWMERELTEARKYMPTKGKKVTPGGRKY